jgi:hypothetical protein
MGARIGRLWIVAEGLEAGDRVVVEGRQKLRDGTPVRPAPMTIGEDGALAPAAAPAGGPADGGGDGKR